MPGSLSAQSERNRSGFSIVEIIVVVGVVAPGEGRSIFGPPVGPFLPALISAREDGDSAACKPGSLNSRGAPSRLLSRRQVLSLQDGPCRV
jgi:hypothetical protein